MSGPENTDEQKQRYPKPPKQQSPVTNDRGEGDGFAAMGILVLVIVIIVFVVRSV